MSTVYDFGSAEFDDAVWAAGHKAFTETLAAGLPVFYVDAQGLNVMECPDGRRFEIRWLPGAPSGENYEVIRELTAHAAQGSVPTLTVIAGPNGMGIECQFGTLVQPQPTPLAVRFGFRTLHPVRQWGTIYDANRE